MHRKSFYKTVTVFALSVLLFLPAGAAWAGGHHPAGPIGWLDGWLAHVTSWFSGAESQTVDSLEQEEGETVETPQSLGDSQDSGEPLTTSTEAGPSVDPIG